MDVEGYFIFLQQDIKNEKRITRKIIHKIS